MPVDLSGFDFDVFDGDSKLDPRHTCKQSFKQSFKQPFNPD